MKSLKFFAIASVLFFSLHSTAQITNTFYASRMMGGTVGSRVGAAQFLCNPDQTILCYIMIDPSLSAFPVGTMPAKCPQCVWVDFRSVSPFGGGGGGGLSGLTTGEMLVATGSTTAGNSAEDEGLTRAGFFSTSLSGIQSGALKLNENQSICPGIMWGPTATSSTYDTQIVRLGAGVIGLDTTTGCLNGSGYGATAEATKFQGYALPGNEAISASYPPVPGLFTGAHDINSPFLGLKGVYQMGSASSNYDTWDFYDSVGSGINPMVTLTLMHTGSSGTAKISLPFALETAHNAGTASVTMSVLSAAGMGAVLSCTPGHRCTDQSGVLSLTTGSSTASGNFASITFASVRTNRPECITQMFYNNESAANSPFPFTNVSSLSLASTSALPASSGFYITYFCMGD